MLDQRMSSKEVGAWRAYELVEPFGELRADMRAASICLAVTAGYVKDPKELKLDDFLLSRLDLDMPALVAELEPIDLRTLATQLGAEVNVRGRD